MIAASKLVDPFRGKDHYAPVFRVVVDGNEVKRDVTYDILQVTYRDQIEQFDVFELAVSNWDAEQQKLKYTDEDLFDPGKKLELWLGYRGAGGPQLMIRGIIKSLQMTYPAGGGPQLAVTGVNILDKFNADSHTATYLNKTDSQIAREIAGKLKVTLEAPGKNETPHAYILQENKSDIMFLLERARQLGYDLYAVESPSGETKLFFGPSKSAQHVYDLKYGLSLTQFTTTLNTAEQVEKVIVRATHPTSKAKVEATANWKSLGLKLLDSGSRLNGLVDRVFRNRKVEITDKPAQSQAEAQRHADGALERLAKRMITGSGATLGLPDLRAGSYVGVYGIGEHFAGRYFVTSTTHTMGGGGYTTSFECRRE